jgi:hypothetical protein
MISQRALPAPALCLSQNHCRETTSLTPAFVLSSDRPPTLLRSRRNVKQSDLGLSFETHEAVSAPGRRHVDLAGPCARLFPRRSFEVGPGRGKRPGRLARRPAPRSRVLPTFGGRSPLAERSYPVGVVGAAVLTTPPREAPSTGSRLQPGTMQVRPSGRSADNRD